MGKPGAYEKAKRKWKKAELDEMTEKFQQLGVENPEGWARTQVIEGIPNLPKMIFLKLMWRTIVKEGDSQWIDREIADAEKNPSDPFIGGGLALKSLRAKGATDEELIDVVRNFQMEYLWDIVMLLDFGANNVGADQRQSSAASARGPMGDVVTCRLFLAVSSQVSSGWSIRDVAGLGPPNFEFSAVNRRIARCSLSYRAGNATRSSALRHPEVRVYL
ncbi:MAG: hypothetical protein IPM54_10165 [Polyangiaceae bacterium]|nr:hypothetical protein [Polyangiaceae bacterium]